MLAMASSTSAVAQHLADRATLENLMQAERHAETLRPDERAAALGQAILALERYWLSVVTSKTLDKATKHDALVRLENAERKTLHAIAIQIALASTTSEHDHYILELERIERELVRPVAMASHLSLTPRRLKHRST